MNKLKRNNKGFTLIELLAVIVILGVLMIIAVPMVTQYITSAKRSAFVATAKAYVSGARYAYLNDDYTCTYNGNNANIDTGSGGAVLIPFSQIKVDKSNGMSSFQNKIMEDKSYVIIESDTMGQYRYYVRMIDEGANGFDYIEDETYLNKKHVKIKGANKDQAVPVAGATNVAVKDENGADKKISKISGVCTLSTGVNY